jgi:hypothetical protein
VAASVGTQIAPARAASTAAVVYTTPAPSVSASSQWASQIIIGPVSFNETPSGNRSYTIIGAIEGTSDKPELCETCKPPAGLTHSRYFRYAAQILDAIVVASAVRGGGVDRGPFGSHRNPVAYMVLLAGEDYIADNVIGANNPRLQIGLNFTLGSFSLYNALKTNHH